MKRLGLALLAASIAALSAPTLFAQLPSGGRFGGDGGGLLLNRSVQDELKLTDDQRTKITEAVLSTRDKYHDQYQEAGKDKEKWRELMHKSGGEIHKAVVATLTPEQQKRLKELHYQTGSPALFTHHDVQRELNLTDKQKQEIRGVVDAYDKESQALRESKEPAREAFRKRVELRKESLAKIQGLFTAEQKQTWKDLTGAPFELRYGRATAAKEEKGEKAEKPVKPKD